MSMEGIQATSTSVDGSSPATHEGSGQTGIKSSASRKRRASGSPSPPDNQKRTRLDGPTASDNAPVDPCCLQCAMYYKLYPGLVCSKPQDSDGPCLSCVVGYKTCVSVKPSVQTRLAKLQHAAKAYLVAPSPENFKTLEDAQDKYTNYVEPSKGNPSGGGQPVNEKSLDEFLVKWIYEQQQPSKTATNMDILRLLPRKRASFAVSQGRSLSVLNFNQPPHMDIAATHLVGEQMVQPCTECQKSQGLFSECVVMTCASGPKSLKGHCTNCLKKKGRLQL